MFDIIKRKFTKKIKEGYRDVKAVILQEEIMTERVSKAVEKNNTLAKSIFTGVFGNITYHDDNLMIYYKIDVEPIEKLAYIKLARTFRDIGFDIYIRKVGDKYCVAMMPEHNLQKYFIDRSIGTDICAIETLRYITD